MYRPGWWNFLLGLRPVQRMVTQEISEAVDRAFERSAEGRRAMRRAADRREAALEREATKLRQDIAVLASRAVESERRTAEVARRAAELKRHVASLRDENERLSAENADLTRRSEVLRKRATARDARRWADILSPENVPVRQHAGGSDSGAECDVFACLDCGSMLILQAPADDEPSWHRPTGEGCDTCADLPCSRPPGRSVAEPPAVVETDLPVPGTREERVDIAAELVAGLAKNSPVEVAADAYAKKAAALTRDVLERISPTQSSSLDTVAGGLDKVSDTVRSGIAWCGTELLGMPDFLGKVLGHVVSELVTDPLHLKEVARAIRVVDTVACALEGDLSKCASLRHLAIMDLGQAELADYLKEIAKDPELAYQLNEITKDLAEVNLAERLKEALVAAIALHKPTELAKPVEQPAPVRKPDRWFKPEPPDVDGPARRWPGRGVLGL
ncbi:hypothetical protein [Actinophytocola sp.]|uniref:hypothetical protein n=1 Tax=Actinophytocola sp. TaxID=1872138 RepID=UPI003D6A4761